MTTSPKRRGLTPTAWRGWAALILAAGVTATLVLLAVETILHTGSISTQESSLLSTTLGATVGAVAVYLGGRSTDLPDPGSSSSRTPAGDTPTSTPEPPAESFPPGA